MFGGELWERLLGGCLDGLGKLLSGFWKEKTFNKNMCWKGKHIAKPYTIMFSVFYYTLCIG